MAAGSMQVACVLTRTIPLTYRHVTREGKQTVRLIQARSLTLSSDRQTCLLPPSFSTYPSLSTSPRVLRMDSTVDFWTGIVGPDIWLGTRQHKISTMPATRSVHSRQVSASLIPRGLLPSLNWRGKCEKSPVPAWFGPFFYRVSTGTLTVSPLTQPQKTLVWSSRSIQCSPEIS